MKILTLISSFIICFINVSFAQDTIIINSNYKYKIGAKFISERSGFDLRESNHVINGGFQLIRIIKNSHFGFESGIYYHQNSAEFQFFIYQHSNTYSVDVPHYYHNLKLPLNLRYDTKVIYFAFGPYINYLLARTSANKDLDIGEQVIDRKLNIGLNLNIGLEKQINKTLNLFVESRYSMDITSAYKKLGRYFSYTNFGFAIGINYKLF